MPSRVGRPRGPRELVCPTGVPARRSRRAATARVICARRARSRGQLRRGTGAFHRPVPAPLGLAGEPSALPDRARVVVIGGGVIGCSVAYHLAHEGWTDVVVIERDRLTSGTTWHAAGLMTCFGSTSETSTGIRLYSRDLYARLEAETGVSTGFRPVGLIEAAADADRLHEYRRVAAFQRHLGLEVDEIGPKEMSDLFPWATDRRPARRLPRAGRRPGQPGRPDPVAGPRRQEPRRPHRRGRAGGRRADLRTAR